MTEVTNGAVGVQYLYGDDLIHQDRAGNLSYYLYDGLGSTRALSDGAGSLTDSYHYDAFGNELARTGSTQNNYLYTGEQFDSSLGFYYLRLRYLNSRIGRFHTMDTFEGVMDDPVTLHKYLYANANPVNGADPTGLFTLIEASASEDIIGIESVGTVSRVVALGNAANDAVYGTATTYGARQLGLLALTGLGTAGVKLFSMLSSSNVTEAEINAAEYAGESVASDQDRRNSRRRDYEKRAMIGENQKKRVIPASVYYQAITIKYRDPYVFDENNMTGKEVVESIAFNRGWIRSLMVLDYIILDIGRDPSRTGNISPWYQAELDAVRGYDKHYPVPWN